MVDEIVAIVIVILITYILGELTYKLITSKRMT